MTTTTSSDDSSPQTSNNEMVFGLVLLRETLSEVRSKLDRTLQLPPSLLTHSHPLDSAEIQDAMTQLMERYSEELSVQVYELFKTKLEERSSRVTSSTGGSHHRSDDNNLMKMT